MVFFSTIWVSAITIKYVICIICIVSVYRIFLFEKCLALYKESFFRYVSVAVLGQLLKPWSSRTSWEGEQPGCWGEHHLGQWWHRSTACSTPRHYGWRVADVWGWFWSSCCLWQHYQPTQEPQRQSIPIRQPRILGHQLLHAQRSSPPQQTVDTSNRELQTSSAGTALYISVHVTSFSAARHDDKIGVWKFNSKIDNSCM